MHLVEQFLCLLLTITISQSAVTLQESEKTYVRQVYRRQTEDGSTIEAEEGEVRLLINPYQPQDEYAGRVEIYHDGRWGTVCDDYWNLSAAQVVCRSLGLLGGVSYGRNRYGAGDLDSEIWLDNVRCTGSEQNLLECPSNPLGEHNCNHYEDAGAACAPPNTNGVCPEGWSKILDSIDSCYYVVYEETYTKDEAEAECSVLQDGAHLVYVEYWEERLALDSFLKTSLEAAGTWQPEDERKFWTAGYFDAGEWKWNPGMRPHIYLDMFNSGEPNGYTDGEHDVCFTYSRTWGLTDERSDLQAGYVCEIDL